MLNACRGRGADNWGREIALQLCQEMGSMKLSDVALFFEVGSDRVVSRSVSRFGVLSRIQGSGRSMTMFARRWPSRVPLETR